MKKSLLIICAAVALSASLAACGQDTPATTAPVQTTPAATATATATADPATTAPVATTDPSAQIPNPWEDCTLEDAYASLGATFTIQPVDGYTLDTVARVSEATIADGAANAARITYKGAADSMLRIHIIKDLSTLADQGEKITTDTGDVYYSESSSSITYVVGDYMVSIDSLGMAKDALLEFAGLVSLAQ